jgi:hypothetical protein
MDVGLDWRQMRAACVFCRCDRDPFRLWLTIGKRKGPPFFADVQDMQSYQ